MENKKEFTCIVCPVGCHLTVTKEENQYNVNGNTCKRGEIYAQQEMIAPKRNIASTIRVEDGFLNLVPVKTDKQIPKEMIFDVMKEINKYRVTAPIKVGDILIENILGTGSNIVATRNIAKNN
ncbi:DUF1667 domain-containing protein [Peptostreptococcus equinus]|uniref:DUF1667 domain-containing protein n=1 Tax=Peptostreptococcus equinus TaxID=3003601 RepID=A0ABY7JNV2_9FIRM|nr:DUF1667 domain-containing protein [Peptostreptococcus sp. CBA3647]WAW15058.1 DUF1667 domain-containing protein [Peptostreptococcus sp. CBA3647]